MKVKIFVLILIVLAVILALPRNKKAEIKEMPVVRIAYGQYISPMFVTQEKGFFEKSARISPNIIKPLVPLIFA